MTPDAMQQWTTAIQKTSSTTPTTTKTAAAKSTYRIGIHAILSKSQVFVPRIQTALLAPSVHHLVTVGTNGPGADEFVGCDPADPDDWMKHVETRARQNTIVANLTFHNKLPPANIDTLLGSLHVNVTAFDGDDAIIPLDSNNAHNNPSASVTMSKNRSVGVHAVAFCIMFTVPVQRGVIPGTYRIPFTALMEFHLNGAAVSSMRPVASSNSSLPFPKILGDSFQKAVISPNGKWVINPDGDWPNCSLSFQCAQGHRRIQIQHAFGPRRILFSSDSSQIWHIGDPGGIEITSVPDGKRVLTIPGDSLPLALVDRLQMVSTTLGFLVESFVQTASEVLYITGFRAAEDDNGQMQLYSKAVDLGGSKAVRIRESLPAQERWKPQVLVSQSNHRGWGPNCLSAVSSDAFRFKVTFGPILLGDSQRLFWRNSLIETNAGWRTLPFATLFDVSIPITDRAVVCAACENGEFRGSVSFGPRPSHLPVDLLSLYSPS